MQSDGLFLDPWDSSTYTSVNDKGFYICISGNSGAGKSTLVRAVGERLLAKNKKTIAIDEKSLHHPFIANLFFETSAFGFELQLNFMLQRVLLVKRWIKAGYNVVMERSHVEDIIFIRHLRDMGHISDQEYQLYNDLWGRLSTRLPLPDLMVFLDVSPELSLKRLLADETAGRRPREFPDEETKNKWIRSWHHLYQGRLMELMTDSSSPMKLLVFNETINIDNVSNKVAEELGI